MDLIIKNEYTEEHSWLVSQCSPDRLPVGCFACIRCGASVIYTPMIFVHLSVSSSGDPAVWRLDYHMRILRHHRRAVAAGSKTNTADKHILHPKPAGFGLLLPAKNGGKEILAIFRCEVSWLTQLAHPALSLQSKHTRSVHTLLKWSGLLLSLSC